MTEAGSAAPRAGTVVPSRRTVADRPRSPDHPFAAYPYSARREADARYVGPEWAAPAPRAEPLPPSARPGCYSRGVAFFGLILLGSCLACFASALVAAFLAPPGGGFAGNGKDPTIAPPPSWACTVGDDAERVRPAYTAGRAYGSARRLRGRVALVSLRVGGGAEAWRGQLGADHQIAGELAAKFFRERSREFAISDLEIEHLPMALESVAFLMPDLKVDDRNRLLPGVPEAIRDQTRETVKAALGATLERLVADYRRKGYDEVAFIVSLPTGGGPRDCAIMAWPGFQDEGFVEMAVLFVARRSLGENAFIFAHEGLHLFGADDLYAIRPRDARDGDDVMGVYCTHVIPATVGDATAWAIGWRDEKPTRAYQLP